MEENTDNTVHKMAEIPGGMDFNMVIESSSDMFENKDEKIFPSEREDLSQIYNLDRFPERKRREARILKKYNFVANACCVYGWKLYTRYYFKKKGSRTKAANDVAKILDVPADSIKVKISQIASCAETGKADRMSDGLYLAYNELKDIHYNELRISLEKYKIYGGDNIEALKAELYSLTYK